MCGFSGYATIDGIVKKDFLIKMKNIKTIIKKIESVDVVLILAALLYVTFLCFQIPKMF